MQSKFILISYDLCGERNYDDLTRYIENYPEHHRITESTWLVSGVEKTSKTIVDELRGFTDNDDRLFVSQLFGPKGWYNLIDDRGLVELDEI